MSLLVPVDLPKLQSLNWAINLQAQYLAPDMSFYNPWQKSRGMTESGNSRRHRATMDRDSNESSADLDSDYSREFIYSLMETVMNR